MSGLRLRSCVRWCVCFAPCGLPLPSVGVWCFRPLGSLLWLPMVNGLLFGVGRSILGWRSLAPLGLRFGMAFAICYWLEACSDFPLFDVVTIQSNVHKNKKGSAFPPFCFLLLMLPSIAVPSFPNCAKFIAKNASHTPLAL